MTLLLGLQTFHPFAYCPSWGAAVGSTPAETATRMADPEMRRRLLAEVDDAIAPMKQFLDPERAFPMSAFPDYEPRPETSIAARARAENRAPMDVFYDVLMEDEGRSLVLRPLLNYTDFSLDAVRTMLEHPTSAWGLGDGGAHCGTTCDASTPTFMLTHWSRDRDHDRLPLPWIVRKMTAETAALYGFEDRGTLTPGRLGDLNLIDYDGLALPAARDGQRSPGRGPPIRAGLAGLRRDRQARGTDPAQRRGSRRASGSTRAERVPEQVARPASERGSGVVAVVQRARTQREATAADARRQLVANRSRTAICSSSRGRHERDSRSQSARFGVRSAGSVASASRISSSVRPTRCAIRTKAIVRNMSRWNRRCPPSVRVGSDQGSRS